MRVKSDTAEFEPELQLLVMRYSLSWLAAGCVVGFLMASLLFHPALGGMLGEFTYGRWVPVHLNFMLFGWSALPSVGVLLKAYLRPGTAGLAQAKLVLNTWSLALAMGGVSWLAGEVSVPRPRRPTSVKAGSKGLEGGSCPGCVGACGGLLRVHRWLRRSERGWRTW